MSYLFHHLISTQARLRPDRNALIHKDLALSYAELLQRVEHAAAGLRGLGLESQARVAVYLPKQPEMITSLFATSLAGGCFVPVNPVLKPPQVRHILTDCGARVLITHSARAQQLLSELEHCHDLRWLILIDGGEFDQPHPLPCQVLSWKELVTTSCVVPCLSNTDSDMAAILYTSGSTGKPKGVVLSHRNLMVGAQSVASYIGNHEQDRILAVLPLSFDAGLSQISTAFASGACAVLLDYLLPNDVLKQVVRHRITGITAVPPLWHQIANLSWTQEAAQSIRYIANTGGHMPQSLLDKLRGTFTRAQPFLMYGLTEAFRSTYLKPADVDRKPGSIGKAIPNAEVLVLRDDGSECLA
ncbi:MAG: acyl-CoA synthetase (AMP-forming)/AMP-acid ligase II, partial [Motiliproteus sp.]